MKRPIADYFALPPSAVLLAVVYVVAVLVVWATS